MFSELFFITCTSMLYDIKLFHFRVPIALFGGTREVDMKLFPVVDVVDYMKEYGHEVVKFTPPQGFIGVGKMDENWGWLR